MALVAQQPLVLVQTKEQLDQILFLAQSLHLAAVAEPPTGIMAVQQTQTVCPADREAALVMQILALQLMLAVQALQVKDTLVEMPRGMPHHIQAAEVVVQAPQVQTVVALALLALAELVFLPLSMVRLHIAQVVVALETMTPQQMLAETAVAVLAVAGIHQFLQRLARQILAEVAAEVAVMPHLELAGTAALALSLFATQEHNAALAVQ